MNLFLRLVIHLKSFSVEYFFAYVSTYLFSLSFFHMGPVFTSVYLFSSFVNKPNELREVSVFGVHSVCISVHNV